MGYTERKDGEATRVPGYLDGFEMSREDAEAMIMQARLKAGWIEPTSGRRGRGEGEEAQGEEEMA